MVRQAVLILGALLALTSGALAAPNVGDRVGSLSGYDAVSKKTVSLTDDLGSWVFVDFWASWCGPCMHELPNLLSATSKLRHSGKLRLFSVSLDTSQTDEALRKVLREAKLDYPVIYDGGGWSAVQAKEWGVDSIPASFLVDPQGTIVATNLRGESLAPALDFFVNGKTPYVPIGASCHAQPKPDGRVALLIDLSSPERKPINVRVDYYYEQWIWAPDDLQHERQPVDAKFYKAHPDGPELETTATFKDAGEIELPVVAPAMDGMQRLDYMIEVEIPGTESLVGGKGIWVTCRGRVPLAALAEPAAPPVPNTPGGTTVPSGRAVPPG